MYINLGSTLNLLCRTTVFKNDTTRVYILLLQNHLEYFNFRFKREVKVVFNWTGLPRTILL